jgi:hypothetical protein
MSSRQVVIEKADLSRLERLVERLIDENRKILEALERNRSEIAKSRLEVLTSFLGSELARVRARKENLERQLTYLQEKFQEVSDLYYTRFKAIIVDYLKNIRDYSKQFLEMAEPEFNSLRRVKAQIELAEAFSRELEEKYSWINEELLSALVNVDLEARIRDMRRLVNALEKLQEYLVAQTKSYRDLREKVDKYSFPRGLAGHGTVLYLPIVAVRCEIRGESTTHFMGPSREAPIVQRILSSPPKLEDKYRVAPSEVDVDKLRRKLATLASDPEERRLLESIEIEVV